MDAFSLIPEILFVITLKVLKRHKKLLTIEELEVELFKLNPELADDTFVPSILPHLYKVAILQLN